MADRRLWTFSPPNLAHLDGDAISALGKALSDLHRQGFLQDCKGGIRSIEVTNHGLGAGWNLHSHEAVDSGWVAQYPRTDIERAPGGGWWEVVSKARVDGRAWQIRRRCWVVSKAHPGLAARFTQVCQRFLELADLGYCLAGRDHPGGHDYADCPDCWYFVDLRAADVGIADEIAKYVVKGSQVVKAGAEVVMDYLSAIRGKRMVQGFGSLYGAKLEDDADEKGELPEREGQCPWPDCSEPGKVAWEFVGYGYPEGAALVYNRETGTSRVVYQGDEGGGGRSRSWWCFKCKGPIDQARDQRCGRCRWLKCSACGACNCDFEG
jgi:hypothetical protein